MKVRLGTGSEIDIHRLWGVRNRPRPVHIQPISSYRPRPVIISSSIGSRRHVVRGRLRD